MDGDPDSGGGNLNGLTVNDVISYSLNSEGKVNKITIEINDPSGAALTLDTTNHLVNSLAMTSKTVFFDVRSSGDPKITSRDAVEGATSPAGVVVADSDFAGRAAIVAITGGTLTSEDKRAVVVSRYRVGDDWYLSLNSKGTVTDYKVTNSSAVAQAVYYDSITSIAGISTNFSDINTGDIIKFRLDGSGKVDSDNVNEELALGVSSGSKDRTVRIAAIEGDQVKVDVYKAGSTNEVDYSVYYVVNDKTHYYNVSSTPKAISFSDLRVGDKVKVIATGVVANVIAVK